MLLDNANPVLESEMQSETQSHVADAENFLHSVDVGSDGVGGSTSASSSTAASTNGNGHANSNAKTMLRRDRDADTQEGDERLGPGQQPLEQGYLQREEPGSSGESGLVELEQELVA